MRVMEFKNKFEGERDLEKEVLMERLQLLPAISL